MTSATTSPSKNLAKFQELLRELFQFDCADLDFGIYRIMNHKRDVIQQFVMDKLPSTVSAELDRGPLAQQANAGADLAKARSELENLAASLEEQAFDEHGALIGRYRTAPASKKYRDALARATEGSRGRDAVEAAIYNHLYTFFGRYYEEGDFISKRRYSRNERYAIPYNGEEVYLHWANSDQYYVKTDEHFRNYDWEAPTGVKVQFRLKNADVEQNNVKGEKRFFIPVSKDTRWNAAETEQNVTGETVIVPFEYRPLTGEEAKRYGNRNQQDSIVATAASEIPARMTDHPATHLAFTQQYRTDGGGSATRLEHHLRQYVRRNNSDFFIHKDLSSFLNRELDFYLKNEVLNLETVSNAGEDLAEGWFQQLRLTKAIGGQIIDFLAQVENFQKMLWEKRKFVTEAQYCITLGTIDPDFYPEILANDCQWTEWRDLFGVADDDRTVEYLGQHPALVFDTCHFQVDFTDRLLASFDDVVAITDGLLVHGDNWQALNMLRETYRERVQCFYLDPPYNTGDSTILYKNGYMNSSWLSLMADRMALSMPFLLDDFAMFVAIDDFEMVDLCRLIDSRFSTMRREMVVVNHHPQGGKAATLSTTHEYMIVCVNDKGGLTLTGRTKNDEVERRPFKRSGTAESNFRYARPNSFYAVLVSPDTHEVVGLEPPPDKDKTDYPTGNTDDGWVRVYPMGENDDERVWRNAYESGLQLLAAQKLECTKQKTIYQLIDPADRTPSLVSNWVDTRYNAGTWGANLLGDIMGRRNAFPYPKSVYTVEDALYSARIRSGGYCADYFAGSGTTGHAVINLNREDGSERKFILVEMGEYFDTVLLPRIKKVTFSPEWKDGKPQRDATEEEAERSPRIVKYVRLESYEDALDNIQFDQPDGELPFYKDDEYLLKYMLRWETRESETLLNVCKMTSPFTYRLRVHVNGEQKERSVDLPETFNYLLGLHVKTRKTYSNGGRHYLAYRGETRDAPGRHVTVIWRETESWCEADFERDRDFVMGNITKNEAGMVYVNGDSCIPNAKPIEPIFKARMFAGASV